MGVYAAHLVPIVAEAMALLDTRHAFVVHGFMDAARTRGNACGQKGSSCGQKGLDEISISGPSKLAHVRNGQITLLEIAPEELGLASAPIESIAGGKTAAENAAILRSMA